jgi:hypothetical protein
MRGRVVAFGGGGVGTNPRLDGRAREIGTWTTGAGATAVGRLTDGLRQSWRLESVGGERRADG